MCPWKSKRRFLEDGKVKGEVSAGQYDTDPVEHTMEGKKRFLVDIYFKAGQSDGYNPWTGLSCFIEAKLAPTMVFFPTIKGLLVLVLIQLVPPRQNLLEEQNKVFIIG